MRRVETNERTIPVTISIKVKNLDFINYLCEEIGQSRSYIINSIIEKLSKEYENNTNLENSIEFGGM